MKKTVLLVLLAVILTVTVFAAVPDNSAKSIICLDRKYTFLDRDNYIYMVSGGEHVAMIRDDNSLWMVGSNLDGRLGIGEIRNAYNAPIKVLENVDRVKIKSNATVALKKDGSVWAFGMNAGKVPTKLYDNVIDADNNGIPAHIDRGGDAYYKYWRKDETFLCGDAREIYVLDNSGGEGLSVTQQSTSYVSFDSIKEYLKKPEFFIVVLKENGDLYEYPVNSYGTMSNGTLVTSGVSKVQATDSGVVLTMTDGRILSGTTSTGLSEISIPGCVEYYSTGFYKKADGTVWRKYDNSCVGKNVKLCAPVGGGVGVFMVHNDNSVSVYSINTDKVDYPARLAAVNGSRAIMSYDRINVDDIKAKVAEVCAGETDTYINAKNLSKWIGKNVKYEKSGHDQSGIEAFRQGTGVCAAFSDLTEIMLTFADVPVLSCRSIEKDHAWNIALIDGVTVFIDNTSDYTENSFDMSMFSQVITDGWEYTACPYDSWAANEVKGAYDWDLVDRRLPTDYRKAIKRDEFCYIVRATIEKARGKSIDAVISDMGKAGTTVPFTDTTDADVSAMYKLGIVNGTSTTTFSPERNITREEAAKILCGLARTLGENTSAPAAAFPDGGKISDWARDSVNFVAHSGIMKGRPTGFDPRNTISIQETILVCYRYITK